MPRLTSKFRPIHHQQLSLKPRYSGQRFHSTTQETFLSFRSHIGAIDELFKACPPQQWKTLSLAIRDALAGAGEKIGLKVDIYVKIEDKEP
jgi:hypothetical protein